ncbi:MAG: hypothetical protein RR191_02940 [Cetobacterium sp.]|uniref:hypothetical protein n=1 Tax=unclassified Cetobacterium TaxID=2630983 RepID=UPI00163D06A8|nr:hypothetical protein [Cetobacterium sp. 2A]MBC2856709.1 hypothetical protein [Cetobacterium sp. 2A]
MWISGEINSKRIRHVEAQLRLCLIRIKKIHEKILEAKDEGKKIKELKYIRMLKSTSIHYEELKSMRYYLTT